MFGSLYYNAWIALLAFTVYFLAKFQTNQLPLSIMLYGLLWAVIAFLLTFILRALIGYIVFTPVEEESPIEELEKDIELASTDENHNKVANTLSSDNPETEDIAKIVQTMLQQDEQ